MRFHPDSDQIAIQDSLSGVINDTVPRDVLMSFIDSGSDHHETSWRAIMQLGLGGLVIPEALGGIGLGLFEASLCAETLGYTATPGSIIGQTLLGTLSERIKNSDTELPFSKLISGDELATFAFGGDGAPESWTVDFKDGKLNGDVDFVPSGEISKLILVGTSGGGLALATTRKGITSEKHPVTDRTRSLSKLTFADTPAVEVCAAGDELAQRVFDAALILLAADALGGAQFCVDTSVSYAKEREQFGQLIGQFQAMKHQLATMAMGVESARAMVWYAAYAWDQELADARRVAALTKAHLCDRGVETARAAIAAHGGIGYTWEYGLNIWFRRSLSNSALLGSPSFHRARAADLAEW